MLEKRKHKFNAKPTICDGYRFDSKKEAARYSRNKLLIRNGKMVFQLRQVPFHLPSGVIYRIDFIEFYTNGDILFVDVKGKDTPQSKQKRRQVEGWSECGKLVYPITITLI
jgi:hypothetical protein